MVPPCIVFHVACSVFVDCSHYLGLDGHLKHKFTHTHTHSLTHSLTHTYTHMHIRKSHERTLCHTPRLPPPAEVAPCTRAYAHKWTLCPCAHAGETARRRDPRTSSYKAVLCPLVKAVSVLHPEEFSSPEE